MAESVEALAKVAKTDL